MGKNSRVVEILNSEEYLEIYNYYKMIACSRYEWLGLPDYIDSRDIELMLYENGIVCCFNDAEYPTCF